MSGKRPFRHCFVRVGYHAATEQALLQFTEGQFYTYDPVDAAAWNQIKTVWPSGTLFNPNWRRTLGIDYSDGDLTTSPETDNF
jgi:hypothetical protein